MFLYVSLLYGSGGKIGNFCIQLTLWSVRAGTSLWDEYRISMLISIKFKNPKTPTGRIHFNYFTSQMKNSSARWNEIVFFSSTLYKWCKIFIREKNEPKPLLNYLHGLMFVQTAPTTCPSNIILTSEILFHFVERNDAWNCRVLKKRRNKSP